MKIKEMPKEGRPRERFLKHGPEVLSDGELGRNNYLRRRIEK